MKRLPPLPGLELAVAGFCIWQASDLVVAWRHSPFDRLGWLSFLIWILPVLYHFARVRRMPASSGPFTVLALTTVLLGRLLDLNGLIAAALALSFASLLPAQPRRAVWLVGAVSWMPLLGWAAHNLPIGVVCAARLIIAIGATALVALPSSRLETE